MMCMIQIESSQLFGESSPRQKQYVVYKTKYIKSPDVNENWYVVYGPADPVTLFPKQISTFLVSPEYEKCIYA